MNPTSWFEYYGDAFPIQDNKIYEYSPDPVDNIALTYVVNSYPELVKVFDTQRFIAKASMIYGTKISQTYNTDTTTTNQENIKCSVREGDIRLAVPRIDNEKYGSRLRGKTASITLNLNGNLTGVSINNIITKYRISWS